MIKLTMYLVIINVLAFFVYGIDKFCAKNNKWRISENFYLDYQ